MFRALLIETATDVCSVAVCEGEKIRALEEARAPQLHASRITLFAQEAVRKAGCTFRGLDAVAVSAGPGSYTGLRIGVSAAKGFCYALDKPLIALSTLHAMARGMQQHCSSEKNILLCPLIDARRMEVFTACYDIALNEIEPPSAKVVDGRTFERLLDRNTVVFGGDGASKCKALYAARTHAHFMDDFHPSASFLAAIALEAWDKKDFCDTAYFEPCYLKHFVAGRQPAA